MMLLAIRGCCSRCHRKSSRWAVGGDRLFLFLHLDRSQGLRLEQWRDQLVGILGDQDRPRLRRPLHPRCHVDGISHQPRHHPLVAQDRLDQHVERSSMISISSSGSSTSAIAVEPVSSQRRMVTIRRSPAASPFAPPPGRRTRWAPAASGAPERRRLSGGPPAACHTWDRRRSRTSNHNRTLNTPSLTPPAGRYLSP